MTNESNLAEVFRQAIIKVGEVVLGKQEHVEKMFTALLCGGHVLLDDTPGMGKTTLARAMSAVLGMTMHRVQFTSDLMPSDLTGINVAQNLLQEGLQFQHGPIFANMVLADEINRASPRTQSALLEAMAERQVTVDGTSHHLPNPFWVVATQNPVDLSGTFPLPDSQMDRFLFRLNVGYPSKEDEIKLLMGVGGDTDILSPLLSTQDVVRAQKEVSVMGISESLASYIQRLISATRQHDGIMTGASPRGALALMHAAKARAWLRGAKYPTPEDVQVNFVDATAHRLVTSDLDFQVKRQIAEDILSTVAINE